MRLTTLLALFACSLLTGASGGQTVLYVDDDATGANDGSMVAEARRRNPDIDFKQANAEALPFDASKFDAVVGNFVLHHLACPTEY